MDRTLCRTLILLVLLIFITMIVQIVGVVKIYRINEDLRVENYKVEMIIKNGGIR